MSSAIMGQCDDDEDVNSNVSSNCMNISDVSVSDDEDNVVSAPCVTPVADSNVAAVGPINQEALDSFFDALALQAPDEEAPLLTRAEASLMQSSKTAQPVSRGFEMMGEKFAATVCNYCVRPCLALFPFGLTLPSSTFFYSVLTVIPVFSSSSSLTLTIPMREVPCER